MSAERDHVLLILEELWQLQDVPKDNMIMQNRVIAHLIGLAASEETLSGRRDPGNFGHRPLMGGGKTYESGAIGRSQALRVHRGGHADDQGWRVPHRARAGVDLRQR